MANDKLTGDLRADGLTIHLGGASGPYAEFGRLIGEPFEGTFGDFELRAQRVVVEGVLTPSDSRTGAITARSASLTGVELTLVDRAADSAPVARLAIHTLELPAGLRIEPGPRLVIPEIVAEDVMMSSEDILRLPAAMREGRRAAAPAEGENPSDSPGPSDSPDPSDSMDGEDQRDSRAVRPRPLLRDFEFLDTIDGQLDVDLYLDVTVPIVGRRDETHEFRVPIADGTFDFHRLEGDVNWLARSVLDIEVADGKLFLEKDIPFIPFDNKTLISWPLDADELQLAGRNRTRLRTLLKWEIPRDGGDKGRDAPDGGRPKKAKKSPLTLHQIATRRIDVALALTRPSALDLGDAGCVRLGSDDQPAIDGLLVSGDLQYARDKALAETMLRVAVKSITASLEGCWLGASCVSTGAIELTSVNNVSLYFAGFRPNRLNGTIERIAVRDLVAHDPGAPAG